LSPREASAILASVEPDGVESRVYRAELDPVGFLRRSAAVFPDRTAVVHGERRYPYRGLADRSWRLAAALRARGLERGDRVAVLAPNIPALLEAHFGVPAAGGVLVAINTRLGRGEIEYVLRHSGARILLVDHELLHLVEGAEGLDVVRIDDTGDDTDPYESLVASVTTVEGSDPALTVVTPLDEEETISINYTSGTTGLQKGVMYTYRGAYLNALGEILEVGLGPGAVYLWTLPMFHCNGWCFPWAVTAVAGTHVCLRKVDAGLIWELLEREGVTHFCGAPTVQIGLVNHPSARRLERPVTVAVAGAPPSPTLLAQMRALDLRPIHVYGLTETYGPHTVCARQPGWDALGDEEQARLLARQGVAYVIAEDVRIVDGRLDDVVPDAQTMGEVVMRGNNVMKGYFDDPDATAAAFAGGWFHSGDIGVMHPDGYVELRDRAKDVIISGGENISTIEVEQAIAAHDAVLECAVVAIPDDTWGERPKAFVTLKEGQELTSDELIEFCRARLARFKCPAAVEFCELPKTSTGKIQKYVLREREWAGRERRIN
jgi:fatty-acyl-CoA synthase